MKQKRNKGLRAGPPALEATVFLNPLSDFGFKCIFATRDNNDLAVDFLNALLNGEPCIDDITLVPVERAGSTDDVRKVIFVLKENPVIMYVLLWKCSVTGRCSSKAEIYIMPPPTCISNWLRAMEIFC